MTDKQAFLLQRVQPAMVGLIDGSLSTLAPIFSVAVVTHKPHFAFVAGILHTLPFLIPHYQAAIYSAIAVVALELLVLAWLRWKFFEVGFVRALASVTLGGVIIAAVSAALGSAG